MIINKIHKNLKILLYSLTLLTLSACSSTTSNSSWNKYLSGEFYSNPADLEIEQGKNKARFEDKYKGKYLYVIGWVEDIDNDSFSVTKLYQAYNENAFSFYNKEAKVGCSVRKDSRKNIFNLNKNDVVVAVGRVNYSADGFLNPIILKDCIWGKKNNINTLAGAKLDIRDSNLFLGDKDSEIELSASEYFQLGNIKEKSGDKLGAVDAYSMAIKIDPNNLNSYHKLGTIKAESGDYSQAINDFNKAIELNPNNDYAYFRRGLIKLNLKDYIGALEDSNMAIRNNQGGLPKSNLYSSPRDSYKFRTLYSYYSLRGIVKGKLGNHEEAVDDLKKSIRIKGNSTMFRDYDSSDKSRSYGFDYIHLGFNLVELGKYNHGCALIKEGIGLGFKEGEELLKNNYCNNVTTPDVRERSFDSF